MKVRQHIPSWADGFDPKQCEVFNAGELLAIPWVERWAFQPKFTRFSIKRDYMNVNPDYVPLLSGEDSMHLLLAEYDGGKSWWVVAYLIGALSSSGFDVLPDWQPKEKIKLQDENLHNP